MYNAARSVVDAMRHRSRIGETLALSALGRYLRRDGRSGVGELQHIARELGALSVIGGPTKATTRLGTHQSGQCAQPALPPQA